MGETNFEFLLDFERVEDAKAMEKRLKKLEEEYRGELAPLVEALLGSDLIEEQDISTDGVRRKLSSVYLFAYGGRNAQPPLEVVAEFHRLGCQRAYLKAHYDEGGEGWYFLGKKRVDINTFTSALRGDKDKEAISKLYLPTERVKIDAKLIKHEWDSNAYGDYRRLDNIISIGL